MSQLSCALDCRLPNTTMKTSYEHSDELLRANSAVEPLPYVQVKRCSRLAVAVGVLAQTN